LDKRKTVIYAFVLLLSVLLVLLQVTILRGPIPYATALLADGVLGVYKDKACTQKTTSISWGVLEPNQTKTVTVYVKNEGATPTYLYITTSSWNPTNATTILKFSWKSDTARIDASETTKVTLTLYLSPGKTKISNFSFNVVVESAQSVPWDANQDGRVNILDVILVQNAQGSTPGTPDWDARADTNSDGRVSILDLILVTQHLEEE